MKISRNVILTAMFLMAFVTRVFAATEITSITASPGTLNPIIGGSTTITVQATPGVTGLEVRVLLPDQITLIRRGLTLTETTPGTYTVSWDGKNDSNAGVVAGMYYIRVFNPGTTTFIGAWSEISISGLSVFPATFTPTGTNAATITVQSTPGQAGTKVRFYSNNYPYYWYDSNGSYDLPLTETSTPGTYTASWNAVFGYAYYGGPYIEPNGTYTVYVVDAGGVQSATTGQIVVAGVSQVTATPATFSALGGGTTTITASGVAGLNLLAKATKYNSTTGKYDAVKTLSMSGSGTTYTALWDGKDDSGNVVPTGSYTLEAWHTGGTGRYYPQGSVQVSVGVASVTPLPATFTPTGTNAATITVKATPGQTGMKVRFYSNNYPYYWYDSKGSIDLPLIETSTPGTYTASWNAVFGYAYYGGPYIEPNASYTVYVIDAGGVQSATTGQIVVAGVSQITVSPTQFTPGGNNFATIIAKDAVGQSIDAKLYNATTNALTRVLTLVGVAGTYTADWDGKDTYGNFVGANNYNVQVTYRDSSIRYYPTASLKVNVAVFTISASPDPFIPDGVNSTTITVRADALQSGLKATVSHPQSGTSAQLPLREVGSAGTYTTTWDGKINEAIPRDGICTIRVYDSAGNQFPATGTFTLSSAKSLAVTPSPYEITGTSTATISAQMPSGLHLEARIGSLKTLPLAETAGTYSAVWDGKDSAGVFAPAGTYTVAIWNVDTQTRYDLQVSLQVRIVDSVPPDTSIISGPVEGSYVSPTNISFNWTGTDNLTGPLTYAYQLDSDVWSAFDTAKWHTFNTLADGLHTFSVKAKDQAGNEDPTPVVRHFTVDGTAPLPASSLIATPTQTGIGLDWTDSPSADVYSYKLYWDNGTGTINYAAPFATIYYPNKTFTASIFKEGTYKYLLRAVDRAGNEELNTDLIASATISGFSVSIDTNGSVHKRGEDVQLSGSVLASDSTPLVNVPVTIEVESKGYVRTYSSYTKTNGAFSYLFQPLATEAGSYNVKTRVLYQGLEKSATASFSIIGMLMEPAQVTIDMSMNSPKAVNINLRNVGTTAMTDLQYTLADGDLSDPVNGFIDTANLPTSLAAGASVVIPILITSDPGTPPSASANFTVNVVSSDGASETARIAVHLHEAVSLPVFNPDPIMVGVRTGEPVTKTVTVTNQGYATMQDSTLTVHDTATYNWVSIPNGTFGTFSPQEAKNCQIVVNPPEGTTLGTYVVQLDLKYNNGTTKPFYMTVEVTTSTVGQVAFKVHDDTGSVVSGAEVNLISKAFYVNDTPNGRQEYNNVLKGTTNAQGYSLFSDVPAGDYRYIVNAVRHDQKDGLLTVEPGSTPQTIGVIMVTNLVNVDFSVTQTTIQDQYNVNLNITYVTDLIKPTLYATPYRVDLSFFPEESPFQGSITIKNTSNNAPVRDVTLDASMLDGTDNEIKIVFDDGTEAGTQKIYLGELGFGQSIQVPYKAVIYGSSPKLNSRNLGNIIATAKYTFSIDGQANESATTTPIPVLYWKPQELGLPGISYLNDETNNQSCNLQYQGTTYRMSVKSNRSMGISLDSLKAVNHVNGGPDAASIISGNSAMWTGSFTPTTLSAKGEIATFDIDDLQAALENSCNSDRSNFLGKPNFIGFTGTWSDRTQKDAYLIPISIITKSTTGIYIGDSSPGGGSWVGGTIPTFNEHGTVKMQIDQKVSLEREAFNAKLNIKPSVTPLDNFKVQVSIKDENGDDASGLFQVLVMQQSGIASVAGSTVSGPVDVTWQLIPYSTAGGTSANGKNYSIVASIDYNYSNGTYSYTTQAETITVKPMPKLTIDYKLPYITMAGKPVKIKAIVTNNGYGPAHNLVIKSAQPKIVENLSNVPVSFTLLGSSATPNDNTLNNSSLDISFGDIPAGGTAEGYWLLSTTKDGYFVEFTSTLTHQDYMGVQLDPLIEAVNTHLIPAIGGEIFMPPNTTEGMKVELYQGGVLRGQDVVNAYGNYLIPDLSAGIYQWELKDANGKLINDPVWDITVFDDQPTARIDYGKPVQLEMPQKLSNETGAKTLILVTHGYRSGTKTADGKADEWPNNLVSKICKKLNLDAYDNADGSKMCKDGRYVIKSYNWRADAQVVNPRTAFENAAGQAQQFLLDDSFDNYHFIAHSAGSNFIDTLSARIKSETKRNPKPMIHTSFLDAYEPDGITDYYGLTSDWSDNYIDTRPLLNENYDHTDIKMDNAFNFYITGLDVEGFDPEPEPVPPTEPSVTDWDYLIKEPIYLKDLAAFILNTTIHRHGWPYRFYEVTVPMTSGIGYPISSESAPTLWGTSSANCIGPIWDGRVLYKGGQCTPVSVTDFSNCGCSTDDFSKGKCIDQQSHTVTEYNTLDLAFASSESLSGEKVLADGSVTLKTGSPSWISFDVDAKEVDKFLAFDFEFKSKSNGIVSVYFNDRMVYRNDERFAVGKKTVSGLRFGRVYNYRNVITFRLDTFGPVQSQIEISNIKIGSVSVVDEFKPVSTFISPAPNQKFSTNIITFFGIATDAVGSGVKAVEVSVDGGATWKLADGTTDWQYIWEVPAGDTYTVLSRATDNAGNVEVPSTGVTFTVSLPDLAPPVGSIVIQDSDAYAKSTLVTLALTASDPSGVTHMCISNTVTCTDWQPLAQSLSWQLANGDGLKTVYAWFRDGVGNSNEQPYFASVSLDTAVPLLNISTLPDGAYTSNATLNISGTLIDVSGIKTLNINTNPVQTSNDSSFSYALPLMAGTNSVVTVATDMAGNSTTDVRIITYDPIAPTLVIKTPMDNSRTNKSFIEVTGEVDENATVAVKVNSAQPEFAAIDNKTFVYIANLTLGGNTVEITAKDFADNSTTAKRTIIYDDLNPSLAITYPPQDITTGLSSIILKGTVSDTLTAVTVSILVDGINFFPPVVNGTFEQTITFTAEKTYSVVVTASDEAGNQSTVQRNIIYGWSDITTQTKISKYNTSYDTKNNCYYVNVGITNNSKAAINPPLRMVVSNPSMPLKTDALVGLKPDGYTTAGEPYFNILTSSDLSLAPRSSIKNLRLNFEGSKAKSTTVTFGVRIEQCK